MSDKSCRMAVCDYIDMFTEVVKMKRIFCLSIFFVVGMLWGDTPWRLQLSHYAKQSNWQMETEERPVITAEALDDAIEAAGMYIMNQQKEEGNFRYAFDFVSGMEDDKDNQVRQAGVLWSVCNLNRERFTEARRRSALLGLDFFMRNQRGLPDTKQVVVTYQATPVIKTGTVALFCLSLVDFLTGQERYITAEQKKPYLTALENNLRFLQFQELSSGSWREEYELNGPRLPDEFAPISPYFDGEALLAYISASKYYHTHPELTPPIPLDERILSALPKLIQKYTVECFVPGGDTTFTKGFYQWGCMSCALASSIYTDEETRKLCLEGCLSLTWWQIFGNRLDTKNGNTGYAIEGLVSAYVLAKRAGMEAESKEIREAIDKTLSRLMTWQVGGPFESYNPFLKTWKGKLPDRVFGGVTSNADSGYIRIDIVQHQLHAMLLARKYIYTEE